MIEYEDKERQVMEWMFTQECIEQMQKMEDNIFEEGKEEQVQKLILKIADMTDDFQDEQTGLLYVNVFKVGLSKALINTYITHIDFERSGR